MNTNELSFKVIEKTLTDNSTVFNLVLRDDRETIVIHCINWQHAERLADELTLAGIHHTFS